MLTDSMTGFESEIRHTLRDEGFDLDSAGLNADRALRAASLHCKRSKTCTVLEQLLYTMLMALFVSVRHLRPAVVDSMQGRTCISARNALN
jgi:hypothetical protein